MSDQLTISATVALLDKLKTALREFASREEKLNQEYQARTEAAAKQWDLAEADAASRQTTQTTEREAAFQAALDRAQARQANRKNWLNKAHKSSQRQVAERINTAEGRRKYEAQKGLLDTTRGRTEALAANDAIQAEFNQQLTDHRAQFVALEEDAAKAFRGYRQLRRLLTADGTPSPFDASGNETQLLEQLHRLEQTTAEALGRFHRFVWPQVFKYLPLWFWVIGLAVATGVLSQALPRFGLASVTTPHLVLGACAVLVLVLAAYFLSARGARPFAGKVAANLEAARQLHNLALEKAQARHHGEIERIESETKQRMQVLEENWEKALQQAAHDREVFPRQLDQQLRRALEKNDAIQRRQQRALKENHAATSTRAKEETASSQQQRTAAHQLRLERFQSEYRAQWETLVADWRAQMEPLLALAAAANTASESEFPNWQHDTWKNWQPPLAFKNAVKVGRLEADLKKLAESTPRDQRLSFPAHVSLPLVLTYPQEGSVLFETTKSGHDAVTGALNNIIVRLLATTPPGKLSFTIIDPIKLGQNFAAIMHLADYEENLINGRIWTQTNQIEQRLADLNEHMEKMIQMYLRNEYPTIAEYNRQAGNIAEKYHFVVIADFPANFSETAARRLLHIAASGARCGVYTLIHWDHRHQTPPNFLPEELRKSSVVINDTGSQLILTHPAAPKAKVELDPAPDPEFATAFLHQIGETSRGANRVEVPFAQIAPTDGEVWSLETTEELRVPIGRSGATKLQELAVGKGTRQHALVAGKTGSGKSTLFHVIITNLALWCRPEEVEFYLVDFKKGVEFKNYATRRLPHARVVAIESDREFGLSVLQRVDDELRRRGDLFRRLGVQDIPGYKRAGGQEPMPRSLLIIDEFQEFFVEDDRISQTAAVLLDRIVRQGRAFGIHVLLGSQTLGGAYSLARTTLGQMVIRVALQCNEADAYLIMDESNPAPRLLSRPGEGIYNDQAGAVEGNSPFQVVWLPDSERDEALMRVRTLADQRPQAYPGPIVFEGNAPADPEENLPLRALLAADVIKPTPVARAWMGAPNSIKGPTEAAFQKRSGNNLLLVGQRDEAVLAILSTTLISLAAQYARGAVRFVLFESTLAGSAERQHLESIIQAIPHEIILARSGDLNSIMNNLSEDLKARTANEGAAAPDVYLLIHGLQNFKKFRQGDDFGFSMDDSTTEGNPAAQLTQIITEGPSHGVHVIASMDTFNNVNRYLGRKTLSEFEMRVLFQMSANDSASLCDDPKASALGLHRALFYNEQEGYLETFRPYALPSARWIDNVRQQLGRLLERS